MLTTRGGTRVIADLTQMGYDTKWTVMGAADIGAPHQRDRMWIVAHTQQQRLEGQSDIWEQEVSWIGSSRPLANTRSVRYKHEDNKIQTRGNSLEPCSTNLANTENKGDVWREWELGFTQQEYNSRGSPIDGSGEWWATEPSVGRVAHGVAHRVDRLKAIGNGQVPLCAATAWRLLTRDWELML